MKTLTIPDMRIPVMWLDGKCDELTARDVLDNAYDIADLGYASRLTRAAVLRHMTVWREAGLPDIRLDEYAQYPDLPPEFRKEMEPISQLRTVHSSTNNGFIDNTPMRLPLSEALSMLLTTQTFVGYKHAPKGSCSPLPSAQRFPVCTTLGDTLDVLVDGLGDHRGEPMWTHDIPWNATTMPTNGWMNWLTMAPHRVQLVVHDDGTVTHLAGKAVKPDDQFKQVTPPKKGDSPRPNSYDPLGYRSGSLRYQASKGLDMVSLDSVFFEDSGGAAQSAMSEHDEFAGWEIIARLTDAKRATQNEYASTIRLPRGFAGAGSYGQLWKDTKQMLRRVAQMGGGLTIKLAPKQKDWPIAERYYRVHEAVELFEHALLTSESPNDLAHKVAKVLFDAMDEATANAKPRALRNSNLRDVYRQIIRDIIALRDSFKTIEQKDQS